MDFQLWSRRSCLVAGSSIATMIAFDRAVAQRANWREYRRNDQGFRIEFPTKPRETDEAESDQHSERLRILQVTAKDSDGVQYQLMCEEFRVPPNPDETFEHTGGVFIQHIPGVRLSRVTALEMPYPAREFVGEPDRGASARPGYCTLRVVVVEKRTIAYGVISERAIAGNQRADQFLRSFKLINRPR